jgi:hypothetical protein
LGETDIWSLREREREYRKKKLDDVHKIFRKNELPKHTQSA